MSYLIGKKGTAKLNYSLEKLYYEAGNCRLKHLQLNALKLNKSVNKQGLNYKFYDLHKEMALSEQCSLRLSALKVLNTETKAS